MIREPYEPIALAEALGGRNYSIAEPAALVEALVKALADVDARVGTRARWDEFSTFWPPRLVRALAQDQAAVFFGAGVSIPSGVPTWTDLLVNHLGMEASVVQDDDLSHDPLTLAELAAHRLGRDRLQSTLRGAIAGTKPPSYGHYLLAALRLPVYLTTNYDCLFEAAWERVNGHRDDLVVCTTDDDVEPNPLTQTANGTTVLLKLHGSTERTDEVLVLTRHDYRMHYRLNTKYFALVRHVLANYHTAFVGFSHRDPEVGRLVEDAIYDFERGLQTARYAAAQSGVSQPHFYSLQFDMREHTPEIFAARGIVALRPDVVDPSITTTPSEIRSAALGRSLGDLVIARHRSDGNPRLDEDLSEISRLLGAELRATMDRLEAAHDDAAAALGRQVRGATLTDDPLLVSLCDELGPLASQGVYLLTEMGRVASFAVPSNIDVTSRLTRLEEEGALHERPYFQEAKSFRRPFVSNFARSIFNGRSTCFVCCPILDRTTMRGLLFAAIQPGQWTTPLRLAAKVAERGAELLVVDGNGLLVIPPKTEFAPTSIDDEPGHVGFDHDAIVRMSRRDVLIRHIARSVVPVAQDDDVLRLDSDLLQYTIVTDLLDTRWKIAISTSLSQTG